jgi:hypothetical protein
MKYIIGRNPAGIILPCLFEAHIRHKDVAKVALKGCDILSAGICSVGSDGLIIVCGESRSLESKPKQGDTETLRKFLHS